MYRIGEFSKLTGISIDRLRNYDALGILTPIQVDEQTGYRYYNEEQILLANKIQILKSMDFSLKEIKQIYCLTNAQMTDLIELKIKEKNTELQILKDKIAQMQHAIYDINNRDEFTLAVNIKKLSKRKLVTLRAIISSFEEEGMLWDKLSLQCKKYNIKLADTAYSYAITHSVDLQKKAIDTEVQRTVEKIVGSIGDLQFIEVPEMFVASIVFKGRYRRIQQIRQYVTKWSESLGYEIVAKPFQIYYVSPHNEVQEEDYITEMCYPIKKKD